MNFLFIYFFIILFQFNLTKDCIEISTSDSSECQLSSEDKEIYNHCCFNSSLSNCIPYDEIDYKESQKIYESDKAKANNKDNSINTDENDNANKTDNTDNLDNTNENNNYTFICDSSSYLKLLLIYSLFLLF